MGMPFLFETPKFTCTSEEGEITTTHECLESDVCGSHPNSFSFESDKLSIA